VELTEQEITQYRIALHDNSLRMMKKFIEAAGTFSIPWEFDSDETTAGTIRTFELDRNRLFLTPEIADLIGTLWKSDCMKKVAQKRNEFWNLDASDYYFDNVERFVQPDFVPNEEDCIMARVITTGIAVTEFDQAMVHFSVVDVGGQRSERKKWIHCFDDVRAIIFVVSLAGYNQVMYEDESHNRMHEELHLFKEVAHNPTFEDTPLFLFLNKKDLFEKMLKEVPLTKCFPEYTGGNDVKQALAFIEEEFRKRTPTDKRSKLKVYPVAARFKKDIKYSWDDLSKSLIETNKRDLKKAASEKQKLNGKS